MSATKPNHLDPSDLGTKKYWDEAYALELKNHTASPSDEGTIWFSDSGAEEKVLAYLEELADEGKLSKEHGDSSQATSFIDLGTGNGHLLFSLRDEGWEGEMLGVDYSSASLQLARQIGESRLQTNSPKKNKDEDQDDGRMGNLSQMPVHFEEYDIFSPHLLQHAPHNGFDVVLDKGTFDAISLSSDTDTSGRRFHESYCDRIKPLIRKGGRFVITSCNWTEDELRTWFEKNEDGIANFDFMDRIRYPRFTFGGVTGQSVVTLCFRNGVEC